jgi:hypothetical protein
MRMSFCPPRDNSQAIVRCLNCVEAPPSYATFCFSARYFHLIGHAKFIMVICVHAKYRVRIFAAKTGIRWIGLGDAGDSWNKDPAYPTRSLSDLSWLNLHLTRASRAKTHGTHSVKYSFFVAQSTCM